jgi:hypothetical protein
MNQLSRAEFERLAAVRGTPSISIYMPTHRAGAEVRQNAVRFKNLLRRIEDDLQVRGMRPPEVKQLLSAGRALAGDDPFWQHQRSGFAAFIAEGLFDPYRLPLEVDELATIGDRFSLKPLLPLLTGENRFFILALSQNQVRLLEGTRHSVREVPVGDIPKGLADAMRFDEEQAQVMFHLGKKTGAGGVYHGHGVMEAEHKEKIRQYFLQVDRGLHDVLRDERAPLLLAGVEYLHPIYRDASTYPHLLPVGLSGNPDGLKPEQLHEEAWAVLQPYFENEVQRAVESWRNLAGTGRASGEIREILPAAVHGRIDRLLLTVDEQRWGRLDETTAIVEEHDTRQAGDHDLIELAAVHTALNGGPVLTIARDRMPDGAGIAAIFRY